MKLSNIDIMYLITIILLNLVLLIDINNYFKFSIINTNFLLYLIYFKTKFNKIIDNQTQMQCQLKVCEEQMEKSLSDKDEINKVMDSFSYTISHDVKTPLRGINSFIEKYYRRLKELGYPIDDEKLNSYTDIIKTSVYKLNTIIADTLTYNKLNTSKANIKPENLYSCVNEIVEKFKYSYSNIIIQNHLQKDLILEFDRSQINGVINHLFDNAIKFNEKEKKVIIIGNKIDTTGEYFYINDNGNGIEKHNYEKVFNLFHKLTNNINGNGIGLAIVKKLIDIHHWHIEVESEIQKGTTFKIYTKDIYKKIKTNNDTKFNSYR